jgi:polyhydroxyalkanoate synthesis regulator phasin
MLSSDELRNLVSKVLADPRVLKLLSSEQLVRVLTLMLGAPDRLGELTQDQVSKLMKRFGIAPVERVEELERRVAELEAALSSRRDSD